MTQAVAELIQSAVERGAIAGAVGVWVRAGESPRVVAGGWRDLERSSPMRADTVFRIASMTKPITSLAALQLVDQGRIELDAPIETVLPALRDAPVLDGYGGDGTPTLRPARRPITLRHLLTHTSGLAYTTWNEKLLEYRRRRPDDTPIAGRDVRTSAPLMFDPGEQWAYGTGTDWVGFAIEAATGRPLAAVLRDAVLEPLGMLDTAFDPPAEPVRLAGLARRRADGGLERLDPASLPPRNFDSGGGGLFSTAVDYGAFLLALLDPTFGTGLLGERLWAEMGKNQIGTLVAGQMQTFEPERSNSVALFAGTDPGWGLGFLINPRAVVGGRAAGSLAWAGIYNSYFWVDRERAVAGALFTQILPFCDPTVLDLLDRFERAVYAGA
ncbi:MAG: beta-lactamase family protein [Ectothiorhodospiraceae bacterium]|nr:beta-lactamase family protein [Ectothiorhodospiraceae bacterium]